jgi:anthranilate synthase component 2
MLLMIDNYDSFTFNLVQYFGELGQEVRVVRNDEISVEEIGAMKPDHLVLSPGPCSPAEAGVCVPAIRALIGKLPILGVCLGHQSIGAALGGRIVRAQRQMHGKASTLTTDGEGVYAGLPREFSVIRYHSLAIERETAVTLSRAPRPRCATRCSQLRWATTCSATTRASTRCRSASRRCWARRRRCSCPPAPRATSRR